MYMPDFGLVLEVVQCAGIAVQAIGDDICLSQRRGALKGDVECASGVFGRPSGRDEEGLNGIEF